MSEWNNQWGGQPISDIEKNNEEGITRFLKHAAVVLGILLVILGGLAYYIFIFRAPQAVAVSVSGTAPSSILNGAPFDYTILVDNTSDVEIKNAQLNDLIPTSLSIVGNGDETRSLTLPILSVAPHDRYTTKLQLLAHGEETSIQEIGLKLSYATEAGGDHRFETTAKSQVSITGSAISLTIGAPEQVSGGKLFEVVLKYRNNLNQDSVS